MNLPAQSAEQQVTPPSENPQPPREMRFPGSLIAVMVVSILVIILCVLGAVASGMFGLFKGLGGLAPEAQETTSTASPGPHVPADHFDDGQWLVEIDIRAGTYETTIPANSAGCTWERNNSPDGTVNSVLETGSGEADTKVVVNIRPTDEIFQASGCGSWRRVGD